MNVVIHSHPKMHMLNCLLCAEQSLSKMESSEIRYSVALTWNVEKENTLEYILWPEVITSLVKEIKLQHILQVKNSEGLQA